MPVALILALTTTPGLAALHVLFALHVAVRWVVPREGHPDWTTLLTLLPLMPVLYVAGATPFLVTFDVRHRRLPNVIVLPGIAVVALCAAAAAVLTHTDPGGTALVAGVTLLGFVTFRMAGAIASGDVKLAVLLAAALAPLASASVALYVLAGSVAALTAGVAALLLLARRGSHDRPGGARPIRPRTAAGLAHLRPGGRNGQALQGIPLQGIPLQGIPLGPFLLFGFWVAVATAIASPL